MVEDVATLQTSTPDPQRQRVQTCHDMSLQSSEHVGLLGSSGVEQEGDQTRSEKNALFGGSVFKKLVLRWLIFICVALALLAGFYC